MMTAILALGILAGLFGLLLGYSAIRFRVEGEPIVEQINAILPQTQCGQCGYAGCRPYAEAIAAGEAEINQCPPGGEANIQALADLLGRDPLPLNEEHGEHKGKQVAVIDESTCIGCTLCLQACPVDAILGAAKQMHTVIAVECTGCELCIEPCPVDCIDMVPVRETIGTWKWPFPEDRREDIAQLPTLRRAVG
ncbi:MAG TPA: electron transport complex subunit RsxB [Gammaproteobacteria bacterium]|nr:electron transport complex subunit RsxB [Gammaproteobacteria bacterium]